MAYYTTVMEEITAYTGLSPAAFFTIVVLMVAHYRTLCGLFVAMGRNINNLILNMNNSSNTTAQPLHQLEEVTDHQLTLPGSSERTTSSMAFQEASSSFSSSTRPWTHDVFLSFRGEDTRLNFTSHLYAALCQKGIKTFKDDDDLRSGEEISQALLKAIEESKISIVVFSQSYASSRWCLDELLKIVGTKGQIVLPVFYKVDPSDVRHQKNSYEKALAKHEERFKDDMKVQSWKKALTQVANLSGWHLENYRNEVEFIDKIVQNVSRMVNGTYLHVAKHPIGIESRVQKINSLLSIGENDIRMVGILGAGGIGKTTIAKDIFNTIASQFNCSCFLANVGETSKQNSGKVELQNTLLSKILGHTEKVNSVDEGITMIKKRLCSKRVLLILDDVNKSDQLDNLAGEVDWFGLGSRIIITTRDRKVLIKHGVVDDLIYKVKELDCNEALELFRWNAFKEDKTTDDFLKLMEGAMNHVGGLPLALEVLGSYLYREDLNVWKSALDKYKSIPHKDILERLKISYDGLDEDDKNIFLDIACFFIGKQEDDIKLLESDDYFPVAGIKVLNDRCLITIDEHKNLAMHNLLRDMGREIVRQESPEHPGKRSRLWCHKDVREVFEDDMGIIKIRGILIDFPEGDMPCLSFQAFKKMKRLRLLMVNGNPRFFEGPIFLSNDLRMLDWPNFPLESLPPNFRGEKLIVLKMPHSHLRRLDGVQKFQNMKIMNFSGCEFLKIIPDVSKIPNLEKLTLDNCTNLVEIHDSVGSHDKLVSLRLNNCYNLSSFPTSLKLRSLKFLNLYGCSSVNHFPEIEWEMKSLQIINFGGTGIKKLPSSIRYLIGLEDLHLAGCRKLKNLPSSIYQLQHLERFVLSGCSKLVKFPEKMGDSEQSMLPPTNSSVSNDGCFSKAFPALQWLDLENCVLLESNFFRIFNCSSTLKVLSLSGTGIVTIPACIKRFVGLKELHLDNCEQLREILAFPQNADNLKVTWCMSLDLNNKCWLPELPGPGPVCVDINMEKFQSMKIMNFSHCQFLKVIPDVSKIPNLEELTFSDCTNLVEIHDSVGSLDKLVSLSLQNCYNLSSFLTSLKLRSLKDLNLYGCSRINHFPEIECEMKYLAYINFGGTGIKKLPSSIRYLIGLFSLGLKDCINLTNLPISIYWLGCLSILDLSGCSKLAKFPEKMDNIHEWISSVSNKSCYSSKFQALNKLDLRNCVLLDSDIFRILEYSGLEKLDLSGSGIVTIPACIEHFVHLKILDLRDCKQLQEIQAFPPYPYWVDARGCMSLDLYNACWSPKHLESGSFDIEVTGNNILDWFSYRKEVSNSNSCEIDIDVPADLDGEITTIAFSTIVETEENVYGSISVDVISGGVEIYHLSKLCLASSECVWLCFHVPESFKRKEYNGHLRVKFVWSDYENLTAVKRYGVHLVRRGVKKKMIDSIDGIQVTKRPRDDDGNLEVNWYPQQKMQRNSSLIEFYEFLDQGTKRPREDEEEDEDSDGDDGGGGDDGDDGNLESNWLPQQKRHSSTLGIRFSDAEEF